MAVRGISPTMPRTRVRASTGRWPIYIDRHIYYNHIHIDVYIIGESIDGSVATADSSFRVKPKPKQGGLFQDPLEKEARGAGTGGAKTKKTVNNISPDTSVASSAASISGSEASLSSSVPGPARPQYHIVSCSNRGVS